MYTEINELRGKLRESEEAQEQLEVELAESNTHSDRIRQDNDKMLELLGETEADCQNTARLIEKLEMERNALKDRLAIVLAELCRFQLQASMLRLY